MGADRRTRAIAGLEVTIAGVVVAFDLLLPSLVLVGAAALSLVARREGPASLGLRRPTHARRLVLAMLVFALVWAPVHVALLDPVVNHLTGERQDTSDFAELQGNVALLLLLVVLSWTLAAFVEELAFRGYVLTRTAEAGGGGRSATVAAIAVSAVLFGLIHTEQGLVGVVLATVDGVAFAVLRLVHRTLWAPVLAHGFGNTIGFVTFFLVGPVGALW
ncbi:CPBP family intramembrane metalloprotease [Nocardioides sp. MAH-18]|uniref:CPBP family intramembrane metalloprotease n=1 Tax=Nocardioides agri TaxID=2682843 RepID=A0A6L6XMK4_9ACTN|nr:MULTISPECIES: CPBP family intramembrane glutamic endopeptidase [unclassified Nocardioides]MBA2953233.1 CPBP family intramembrane metalloprotease [Nocardioides sp. CGMCC 1.13656]MVQ48102.1 CPBP family intramembrane metalloprotease [Nocardioides sp. MAH-18]